MLKERKGSLGGLGPQGSPQWQKVVTCCREKDAGGGDGESGIFVNSLINLKTNIQTNLKTKTKGVRETRGGDGERECHFC